MAKFYEAANFKDAQCTSGATFRRAAFHQDAEVTFLGARFGGEVEVDTKARLVLSGCKFYSKVEFGVRKFLCPVIFRGTEFHDDVSFEGAKFLSEVRPDFKQARFEALVSFARCKFSAPLDLREASLASGVELDVRELEFHGSQDLHGNVRLRLSQIRIPRFARWPRWFYKGRIRGERAAETEMAKRAFWQYGRLRENFGVQYYPQAMELQDWCHYRHMDLRRQVRYARWNPLRLVDRFFLKWCFGYGVFTKRILLAGIGVILFFGLLFAFVVPDSVQEPPGLLADLGILAPRGLAGIPHWYSRVSQGLYFSAITFATIGYGDWRPVGWARYIAAFEGLLGLFIMALFTVSYGRKLIRR